MAKKKYSINWDDDKAVSFEVNGVEYKSLDDVLNEDDRLKLEAMLDSAEDAEFDAEFAKMDIDVPQADETPIENIILPIFTGVAVLMLLIAGIASFSNIAKINREASAPGRVTDMTKQLEYDEEDRDRVVGEAYYPVVEFVALDGKRRTVQLDEGSFPAAYEVGDEVTILYEPDHPLDARIKWMVRFGWHVDSARHHRDLGNRFFRCCALGAPGDVQCRSLFTHNSISLMDNPQRCGKVVIALCFDLIAH